MSRQEKLDRITNVLEDLASILDSDTLANLIKNQSPTIKQRALIVKAVASSLKRDCTAFIEQTLPEQQFIYVFNAIIERFGFIKNHIDQTIQMC